MGGEGLGNSGNARKKTFFFQLTPSLSLEDIGLKLLIDLIYPSNQYKNQKGKTGHVLEW